MTAVMPRNILRHELVGLEVDVIGDDVFRIRIATIP